jgi:CelD/BcsL family acetyltransferase involved in cellulose biosynthesis
MIPSLEMGTDLCARVLRSVAELKQISSDWRDLFHRCRVTGFQSPGWLLPWIEVFSPGKMIFVEVRCANLLVAVAPLLIYRRDSERVLAFMGGGVSDYLDLLVDPAFEPQAVGEIICAILDVHEDWTVLDLTDLPSHSPLLRIPFLDGSVRAHDSCSVLRLPSTREDLLHLFSKRQRANLRNAHSRLDRAGGGHVEIATGETLSEFLENLFTLHTNRWSEQGESGVLDDERVRRFHSSCAAALLQDGLLHLTRLRLTNRSIAVVYSLLSDGTAYCYLQGFDPDFSWLSPGTQLMFSVMSDAVARGMVEFDFLRGREAYKQHWRAESKPTFRIQLPRATLATIPKTLLEQAPNR